MRKNRETEGCPEGNEAAPGELGNDPREVGSESAGQAGDTQRLSIVEDADNESVEELAEDDQGIEAATVEGVEDAADHRSGRCTRTTNTVVPMTCRLPGRVTEKRLRSTLTG